MLQFHNSTSVKPWKDYHNKFSIKLKMSCNIKGFPRVLIAVGHFLDSYLLELNFICWKLDSMAPFLDRLVANSYWICPTRMLECPIPITISSFLVRKSQ